MAWTAWQTWTHRATTSRLVRFLQDAAIVITPQQHAKHHKPPFDKYYCTVTNLVNPVLERLYFWRSVEAVIALAGVQPKRMTAERGYL